MLRLEASCCQTVTTTCEAARSRKLEEDSGGLAPTDGMLVREGLNLSRYDREHLLSYLLCEGLDIVLVITTPAVINVLHTTLPVQPEL
ncbi:hypothetical protein C8Q80DRAFT_1202927 [Daedaleopsis nitida]|nr:hypothetical protein C8Q80DRAFT_1202927 [Daedaleopsis nitida]